MSISANRRIGGLLSLLLCGGCAVGPNFHIPAPPRLDRYQASPAAPVSARVADAGEVVLGGEVDPAWWRLFGSPALDDLVQAGLKRSPTLAAARATLAQGRDLARAGAGVFLPSLDGGFDAVRERASPLRQGAPGAASTFSLYTATGAVTYALDLFGGERRGVEALNASAEGQDAAVGAAYLLLTGAVVDAAIARAGYADQAACLEDIVAEDAAQRDMLAAQNQAGQGALSAVLNADQQTAADRQSLVASRQRLAASRTLLNALIGLEPAEASPSPPSLSDLALPGAVPVSLPSQLVRQRPDILQAQAALHQAGAEVGVATAALFPSVTLTGDYGAVSTDLGRLSAPAGRFWSVGPSVEIPIFHAGALWFDRRAAQAAYDKARADYRQTVLTALEQVADQIKALDADAEISGQSALAADAASLNQNLGQTELQAGVIAGYDAAGLRLQADRARLALIAAKAAQMQDVVALYLASGGGWRVGAGTGS